MAIDGAELGKQVAIQVERCLVLGVVREPRGPLAIGMDPEAAYSGVRPETPQNRLTALSQSFLEDGVASLYSSMTMRFTIRDCLTARLRFILWVTLFTYSERRRTTPGNSLVCLPSATTRVPFTMTSWIPSGN